jgi:hypothetical protein
MMTNRLKINVEKTQLIWIGTRQQLDKITVNELQLPSSTVPFSAAVTDLGIIVDGELKMNEHVSKLCRSCYFQLRQLRQIRSSLTLDARKTLAHAFISSRLDYCNSLLYGVAEGLLSKLQSVQNAVARFVTGTGKYHHITPVLRHLHWLPIRQRIAFKLAVLVYKCLHGLAPSYLSDDCVLGSSFPSRSALRSSSRRELVWSGKASGPRMRTFGASGPTVWNALPTELHEQELSIDNFRRKLKAHLYKSYFT